MDVMLDAVAILGMFVLRLGVPLAATLLVGYLLHRLDARWQAETIAQQESQETGTEQRPASYAVAQSPCWVEKGCNEVARAECPAFTTQDVPCWLARTQTEGTLPSLCADCELYNSQYTEYNQVH